ncbi:helix-turn-helix domain-containing protein [Streptomyces kaniharaensis]|uniref:Helix-turn-helix domain-containing protein n=1 Tax=Streptomyces kaniharaensis TaxID=212423 RepID=A0A6N7KRP1_9ACTN|nr:helix-turn-helix transcriptional regulator [Streptomyces kaniharaensis]MQS14091.1 helix-turn-helix domain-containing protein [Streptomyces kaniharaensis]
MTTPKQNPMAWKYCGDQIKRWREQAGVTREQLSTAASYDYESVRSMEAGRRKPSLQLLTVADELCNARGMLLGAVDYLKPEKFPSYSQGFTDAEVEAIAIHSYDALLIPGLLQTEEYARELISHSYPPLDDETIEARVASRIQRQEKLRRSPTVMFGFVIYEAAFRALVGNAGVMKRQLEHLLNIGKLRNVTIQVLPADRVAYVALEGPMVLLETPEHEQLAYIEGQYAGVLHADIEKVSVLVQRHGMIRSQALSIEESESFIRALAEEL